MNNHRDEQGMLLLNADDVRRTLPMSELIAATKQAFAALAQQRALVPPRIHLPVARNAGVTLVMPALIDDPASSALAVKVVSVFDNNAQRGLARIQAAVLAVDPETGRPLALLEGATLTARRTAAASGAATDLLARPDSRVLAILGAGVQARTHLEAVCAVRPIETVWIYAPTRVHVEMLVAEASGHPDLPTDLRVAESPRQALSDADIVCATTTSRTPVLEDGDLKPGVHVNAVGAYTPETREIPSQTVARSLVVVDQREAAWAEAGDLIHPLHEGRISRDHIHAELGQLVLGTQPGRTRPDQTTFFKSVGIAVQDAAAAQLALSNAARLGMGLSVPW